MKVNKVNTIATKIVKSPKTDIKKAAEILKAKKYPNWVGLPGENYGNNVVYKIAFFPEDLEKMKSMTEEEASWYRARLCAEHRYYRDDKPIVMSEELAAILGDLSQYEVK